MKLVIGHRGAAAYAPENTLAAFEKARTLGCPCIEFDVMLSEDGEAFIFHDDKLKRTTNGRGEVGSVSASYLKSLDAGRWFGKQFAGEKIPTLQETLSWLVKSGMDANIEIKPYPGTTEKTTLAVLSHLNRFWPSEKKLPLVSSFDLEALKLCRSLAPELPIGLLLDKWREDWQLLAHELTCTSVHLSKRITTAARIATIKHQGFAVYVYTVNRKRQANKLFAWGVDAIFSDYPDL